MATVQLERVTKRYSGGGEVVRDLDLSIADGELITLVGPSGCGKSTTLNLIAGFERPTSGQVRIDGEIVNDVPPRLRGVAMVFQSYALYPHMTVAENIGFPLEVAGMKRSEREREVRGIAERLSIGHLLARRPRELSGGQRQRVALGRALVRKPSLCLFDEPLSNLDAQLRGQMRMEIKKLHEQTGATFVYVTHDQTEAMTLSDRIVILDRGRVQQCAPPGAIYHRPTNLFVARFVGSPAINVLDSGLLGLAGDSLVGIRPEHVHVGGGIPPAGGLSGRVFLWEPTGPETWVTLDLGSDRIVGRAVDGFEAAPGAPAWFSFDPVSCMRFDRSTNQRLD